MALIDLGKLKFTWKGTYANSTAYETDDVVFYEGSSYVATADIPASNTTNPYLNASFDLMNQGFDYEGIWLNSVSYANLSVVTHASATWVATQTTTVGEVPSSSSSQWDLLIPVPANNVLTSVGDMVVRDNANNSARIPVGPKGTTLQVLESPNHSIPKNITYSVGTDTPATAILTDGDNASNVYGTNAVNGAINMSRERVYSITFPADGQTYSIKNPNDPSYNTAGTGGRLTSGVTPAFVSNGGTISLVVSSTTPSTLKIRNEASGTDEATVTVLDLALVPGFPAAAPKSADVSATRCNYDYRNTMTTSLKALEQNPEFGRGSKSLPAGYAGTVSNAVLTNTGQPMVWGNCQNQATTAIDAGSNGFNYGSTNLNVSTHSPHIAQVVVPNFFESAIAGVADDAKFLSDLEGKSLNYTTSCIPKITEQYKTRQHQYCLSENGIIFFAGYGGQPGADGAGAVTAQTYALIALRAYNETGTTELTGVNRPKFKQVVFNSAGEQSGGAVLQGGTLYGLSTDGEVFAMGDNGEGQLGDNTVADNYYFRRINPTSFNNEKVIYINAFGSNYGTAYAITETGKLFGWGYNTTGVLGDGTAVDKTTPIEMTGVAGSAINGKSVTHIMGNSTWWQTYGRLFILTTEGKVYALGNQETHGIYIGVYNTVSAAGYLYTPTELTDAATTINSEGQQVVSMWMSNTRYTTQYFITDGGTPGLPRMYSCGQNLYNHQGTNSSTTNGATTSSQGNWFLSECVYRTGSDDASCLTRPNITTQLKIGDPCAVFWAGSTSAANGSGTTSQAWLLDSNGQFFITGYFGTYNPVLYTEQDNVVDFEGTSTNNRGWVPVNTQPEPMVSFGSSYLAANQENWYCVGESGKLYFGGSSLGEHHSYSFQGFQLKNFGSNSTAN